MKINDDGVKWHGFLQDSASSNGSRCNRIAGFACFNPGSMDLMPEEANCTLYINSSSPQSYGRPSRNHQKSQVMVGDWKPFMGRNDVSRPSSGSVGWMVCVCLCYFIVAVVVVMVVLVVCFQLLLLAVVFDVVVFCVSSGGLSLLLLLLWCLSVVLLWCFLVVADAVDVVIILVVFCCSCCCWYCWCCCCRCSWYCFSSCLYPWFCKECLSWVPCQSRWK